MICGRRSIRRGAFVIIIIVVVCPSVVGSISLDWNENIVGWKLLLNPSGFSKQTKSENYQNKSSRRIHFQIQVKNWFRIQYLWKKLHGSDWFIGQSVCGPRPPDLTTVKMVGIVDELSLHYPLGSRIKVGKNHGTVRYVGEVNSSNSAVSQHQSIGFCFICI